MLRRRRVIATSPTSGPTWSCTLGWNICWLFMRVWLSPRLETCTGSVQNDSSAIPAILTVQLFPYAVRSQSKSFFNRSNATIESNTAGVPDVILFLLPLYVCIIIEPQVSWKKSRVNDWFQSKLALFTVHLLSMLCGNFRLKSTQSASWLTRKRKLAASQKIGHLFIMIIFNFILVISLHQLLIHKTRLKY